MRRRGLQAVLAVLGVIAVTMGVLAVAFGVSIVPDSGVVAASVDSEMRFFAAWYVGAGLLLLQVARDVDGRGATLRWLCAILLLGAAGRMVSMVTVGMPHPLFVALTVVEIAIPALVLPWQAAVGRDGGRGTRPVAVMRGG